MNNKEAISQLESLRADCKEFVSIEPKEKDVQALEIVIAALKETAQEVPVIEQKKGRLLLFILPVIGIVLAVLGLIL